MQSTDPGSFPWSHCMLSFIIAKMRVCVLVLAVLVSVSQAIYGSFPEFIEDKLNAVVAANPNNCANGESHVVVSWIGQFTPYAGDDQFTGAAWSVPGGAGEDFSGPSNGFRTFTYCVPHAVRKFKVRELAFSSNVAPENLCHAGDTCGFVVLSNGVLSYEKTWLGSYLTDYITRKNVDVYLY
jgi:hypothetical protein